MKEKINTLTSLRFFAAAFIVVGHGGNLPGFESFRFQGFNLNNAVSFFFVLSGFIMSLSYYGMDIKRNFRHFITARFSRIYPAHFFMFIVYFCVFGPNIFHEGAGTYTPVALTNILLLQSWVPFAQYFFSYNAVSWSISTEFAFYLFFPLLLLTSRKYGAGWLLLPLLLTAAVLGGAVVMDLPQSSADGGVTSTGLLYISPLSRLAEFSFGMMMYAVFLRLKTFRLSVTTATCIEIFILAVMVFSFIALTACGTDLKGTPLDAFGYWLSFAGSFICIGLMILVMARQEGHISSLLKSRGLVYLGEISFSLYMCHRLILALAYAFFPGVAKENPVTGYMSYWIISLLLSAIMYHFIESPGRRKIRKILSPGYSN
ncbi:MULTISPECIES: acyltransferase family protein [Klebsiella pneumoniae complex]|uniref:acyltransferase family protein n=1 Tax=Klebsiella pneumoniae complex TaxID=3390273 RepID=UPI00109D0C8D|nr:MULTISPECIES: acyltransferase [Klebsiella]HDW0214306.1 acyltransferase [Klebsiella michiganensis]UDC52454.1 acyltransferase [Klebsiella quasipneumoniae subsp. similipneumoniae]UDD10123.1 acyltransferase [Klebsiella pneumoniae]VGO90986.1 hypothetical protein SB00610_00135 [Klebsiella quasipneumoniae subsp. similipneumoniae]VGP65350.1 hypothetical protein SB00612_04150 [Klebsiella pneumoniae]